MKIAFTIGAYRLCDFVKLGIAQLGAIAPSHPIFISDDLSPESEHMEQMCKELLVPIMPSESKRGHFAGDLQALINALAFAEMVEADVAVKLSQRLILKQGALEAIQERFSDPSLCFASPGQPTTGAGFAKFPVLSDFVAIRVSSITTQQLIDHYRHRVVTEQVPWKTFIESFVHSLHINVFPGRSKMLDEFTNVEPRRLYLRRYQSPEQQYRELAAAHGLGGQFPMAEWGQIDGRTYRPNPVVI